MKTKTTVIHHSADYGGIFCREIARKFLPEAELIGWDFVDAPLSIPDGQIYVMDLPVDRVFGFDFSKLDKKGGDFQQRVIWIDHHKSSIETHPKEIPGYRIDGVAACRLAWQWFTNQLQPKWNGENGERIGNPNLPTDVQFKNREVAEPHAVTLAGEYDIWDHRDEQQDVAFQFGLDADFDRLNWEGLLDEGKSKFFCVDVLKSGYAAMRCYAKRDADVMRSRSFLVEWEGLKFLALNTPRCNSNTFNVRDIPNTGHDALMAFFYNGKDWNFSLYHAAHRKDLDLSLIASKYGGGGHRGACGFRCAKLPFISSTQTQT